MSNKVIIYHDKCHDGITALWCALQSNWDDAEPYPAKYDEPPDLDRLRDKEVLIVDFSWKRGPILQVAEVAKSLLVLDHHRSAEVELEGLDFCVFDMERSGAGIAWDHLVGGPRPALVDHVEDRDLWRFALDDTKEIHAACNSYPLDLKHREQLMKATTYQLADEGRAILRYHDKLVESSAKYPKRQTIAGHDVPTINCPTIELVSDICHLLAKGEPFAATWFEKPNGDVVYQLRSAPDGIDVSEVAAQHGGGGHKHAAGFTTKA
jgi:nanoRNase/pAp phosphatase (c-di-AMP/oligoRNAs hydrolase)